MKHLVITLLLATLCAVTGHGQTIKSLGYNTTNGQIVANTTNSLIVTNEVFFQKDFKIGNSGGAGQVQILFSTDAGAIRFYNRIEDANVLVLRGDTDPVELGSQWNHPSVRSSLGLPLPALTNTSNVTMMRALSGSTNTNEPYSGSVSLTNTNTLVFSNGILLRTQ